MKKKGEKTLFRILSVWYVYSATAKSLFTAEGHFNIPFSLYSTAWTINVNEWLQSTFSKQLLYCTVPAVCRMDVQSSDLLPFTLAQHKTNVRVTDRLSKCLQGPPADKAGQSWPITLRHRKWLGCHSASPLHRMPDLCWACTTFSSRTRRSWTKHTAEENKTL